MKHIDCNRWRFQAYENEFCWLTPRFMIDVSVGGYDGRIHGRSWHVRFWWRRNHQALAGDELFLRYRAWEFRHTFDLYQRFQGF